MSIADRPEHDPAHCREMFAHLSEYLDRELDETACREIEQHLRHCDACRACCATLARTVALCRGMPAHAVPETMSTRLREAIEKLRSGDGTVSGAGPD
ncbi:MAG: zf-HC2 domain-containing protein [Desulfobacterales bacterium]|jgi:anti-sigma factor RsiW|nr:zf-HC2 domain-containing protein [Desulfobacteraceae bacterium]MDD3991423.1 zf-HC2 domain-containing protein [Desulfobacteraceae bacterium]MDY0311296.1 zf-HC2 domain-containing protein [Desulfobacterales bacterium]